MPISADALKTQRRVRRTSVVFLCAMMTCSAAEPDSLVIANVHVVDVAKGAVTDLVDVSIDGNRIAAVSKASASGPRAAVVHDAKGGFLVPGFWDMHAHVNSPEYAESWTLPLFLAAGVTGVRDMSGDCFEPACENDIYFMRSLQKRIASGKLMGPRILAIGSALIDGPRARAAGVAQWTTPGDEAQSRALVDELRKRGVDFIKPYDTMPRSAYFSLVRAAREAGLPVSGHVPMSVSAVEAVQAGQTTIEHAKHPAIDCSGYSRTFHETFERWAVGRSPRIYTSWADGTRRDDNLGGYYGSILANFDEALCKQVIEDIAASGAHYVPTLITRRFEALADRESFLADPRLELVPPRLRSKWAEDAEHYREYFASSPAEKRAYLELYELAVQLVGKAHAAGVPILVGTDASDSYCFPGSGLLDEMRELRSAGLSNAAILRAATLDAAKFMHRDSDHGSVAPGKIADLVLLGDNPLEDIDHVGQPRAVVFDGRLLDAKALHALTARAAAYAAAKAPQASDARR